MAGMILAVMETEDGRVGDELSEDEASAIGLI